MYAATTQISMLAQGRCSARCRTYPDHVPMLSVWTPIAHLLVSGASGWLVSDEEVAFARELQSAAATYCQEVEAWANRLDTGPQPAIGGDLA